jgi:hypothetical protein
MAFGSQLFLFIAETLLLVSKSLNFIPQLFVLSFLDHVFLSDLFPALLSSEHLP